MKQHRLLQDAHIYARALINNQYDNKLLYVVSERLTVESQQSSQVNTVRALIVVPHIWLVKPCVVGNLFLQFQGSPAMTVTRNIF